MRIQQRRTARRGAILPYVAISCVALCGFVALSIDLGMIMAAKTQTQNAADAAAFAGARSLTGGTTANLSTATSNGQAVAGARFISVRIASPAECRARASIQCPRLISASKPIASMKYTAGGAPQPPNQCPSSAIRLYPNATLAPIAMSVSMLLVPWRSARNALE